MIAIRKKNSGVKALLKPVKPAAFLFRITTNMESTKVTPVMKVKISGIIRLSFTYSVQSV